MPCKRLHPATHWQHDKSGQAAPVGGQTSSFITVHSLDTQTMATGLWLMSPSDIPLGAGGEHGAVDSEHRATGRYSLFQQCSRPLSPTRSWPKGGEMQQTL